ncbi:IclR family transcriptional regulator [Arthrobacter sp. NIO-1057]|uniref:IclR family transcriptional regulator n=1 Tax=Arthrobacter sp. NIO-1057 TaxID=993071 RepID=UPI00071DF39F|nr:IclR family transcriptional regulator [Arthrobacter sp. NIO-1057]KSU65240.1 IclR family transcriptional regulator [Arthrobacter sp. NIO-1057]SCC43226.1 transcriptional regulator, IclR family [Arthrobacter sp. NIO-1057]
MGSKVPAADNTLRILRLLASRKSPTPAAMIASLLQLPRSSVYQLLTVMNERGFVTHYPEDKSYGLGIAAFELSSAYTRQEPLARLGAPLIAQLVDKVGESAHLAILHGSDVLYIVEERAKGRPSLVTDVGVRLPSHLTASGRAILAALPKSQVRALYPNAASFTDRVEQSSITSYSQLRRELEQCTQRGYAVERGDVTEDFHSLAVEIRDANDWPVAAVAVTFLAEKVPEERHEILLTHIRSTATALTSRIQGRRPA